MRLLALTDPDGVMDQTHLFPHIRQYFKEFLNGYVQSLSILVNADSYIAPPALGPRAGVLGALALAQQALN
jgi:fructokinase